MLGSRRVKNDRLNHAGYLWAFAAPNGSPGAKARYRHQVDACLPSPPDPTDLTLLIRASQDSDERIRTSVVGTLGSHGTNPAAVDLLMSLLNDPSAQVRVSTLSSLGFLQQAGTLPKIRLLVDDSSPLVRAWVAIALGRIPAPEVCNFASSQVLDRLEADPDPYVREQAANVRRFTPRRGC